MSVLESCILLFIDSLVAAFIVPINSEMAVYALAVFGNFNSWLVFIVALLGSVSGSVINWWIGKKLIFLKKSKFFVKYSQEIAIAKIKWEKYVVWSLFFASLKVIGNPLTLLAGFFETNFRKFLAIIVIGKAVFYYLTVFYF